MARVGEDFVALLDAERLLPSGADANEHQAVALPVGSHTRLLVQEERGSQRKDMKKPTMIKMVGAAMVAAAALALGPLAHAEGVDLHGFGGWAYGQTDGNNYLVGTPKQAATTTTASRSTSTPSSATASPSSASSSSSSGPATTTWTAAWTSRSPSGR